MKLKLGQKLQEVRESRKMSQAEFSDFLGMSQSTYARLERNESKADLEQIVKISEKCNIPIQDLLPDFLSFNNQSNQGPSGVVLGNYTNNYYGQASEAVTDIQGKHDKEISLLVAENQHLREKIILLEEQIHTLQNILSAKQ